MTYTKTIFSRVVLFALLAAYVAADLGGGQISEKKKDKHDHQPKKQVEMVGNYTMVSDLKAKDLNEVLKAMEFSDKHREKIRNADDFMMVITKQDEEWTVKRMINNKTHEDTFESGEEFEGALCDGRKFKSTVTVHEKEKRWERVIKMDGFDTKMEAKFTQKGFKGMIKVKNATAKVTFKRMPDAPKFGGFEQFIEAMKNFTAIFKEAFKQRKNDSSEEDGGDDGWSSFNLFKKDNKKHD